MSNIILAIDVMGGDHGITTVIPAVIASAQQFPHIHYLLVGDPVAIEQAVSDKISKTQYSIQAASEVVAMDEPPAQALRHKKDSSMRVALNAVKDNKAQAMISAGNTGALMATSRYVLGMLPTVDRPALMAALPSSNQQCVYVLDLGANVDCSAEQLLQFALMANAYCETVLQKSKPRIRLLNVGSEDIKGNSVVKAAAELLSAQPQLNYQGFIEGDGIFKNEADIVVCDGFVGNIVLKAAEGIAKLIFGSIRSAFYRSFFNRIRGAIAKPALKIVAQEFNPERYNGSCLLGLNQIVIKSHGSASSRAFAYAIEQAIIAAEQNLPQKISQALATYEIPS